ncbi:MAG: tRNA guanosine(34) transglycosylase Tgt [Deltaproteobacteria bacterium]|jgi:queuine tRNA-ribosyltransferase|nr:tRNA guanosine(34) transglycosylase Tgt [Deltaproteobacteria bacterium]
MHNKKDHITPGLFRIKAQDGRARRATLHTAHGPVETPVFMPVGTAGSVKAVAPDDLLAIGAGIILGNTYHLYLRPGDELVARHGGLHQFTAYPGPFLTDSGGFQVFSLSALRKITEEGVVFNSHLDGGRHLFTPEKVVRIQRNLNSDVMLALDECVAYGSSREYTEKSVRLTSRWALRSLDAYHAGQAEARSDNLLFAVTQGGFFTDLRKASVEDLCCRDFAGFAIGGLSVGEPKDEMYAMLDFTAALLPRDKPRYLMGVGTPLDIVTGISLGIDMFDCVLPTRNARNGTLYTSRGKINIKRREYADDDRPLDEACNCYTCRGFSRAYLRHLFVSGELLALRLNSIHNLAYFIDLTRRARASIENNTFDRFKAEIESVFQVTTDIRIEK